MYATIPTRFEVGAHNAVETYTRLDETHIFAVSYYDKPHDYFESTKFLTFEIEAMAKSYIMESLEDQLAEIRGECDDDDDD